MKAFALIVFAISASVAARAEWLDVEIGSIPQRPTCAAIGTIDMAPGLIVCGEGGTLYFFHWVNGVWRQQIVESRQAYPTTMLIADRGDGRSRLYLASGNYDSVTELEYAGSIGWIANRLPIPGRATSFLSAGRAFEDRRTHFLFNRAMAIAPDARLFAPNILSAAPGNPCGSVTINNLYDCTWSKPKWTCDLLAENICDKPSIFLPGRKGREFDAIVGQTVFTNQQGRWQVVNSMDSRRNLLANPSRPDGVVSDGVEYSFSDDFRSVNKIVLEPRMGDTFTRNEGATLKVDIDGAFRSMTSANLRGDGVKRFYASGNDNGISEYQASSESWKSLRIIDSGGPSEFLVSGDARGDGRPRLYSIFEGANINQKGHIEEIAFFPKARVVVVPDAEIEAPQGETWASNAEAVLGDFFRSELSRFNALAVIDKDQMQHVLAERQFQLTNCRSEACLARIGSLLKAEAVIACHIRKIGNKLKLSAELRDLSGNGESRLMTEEFAPEGEVLPAIQRLAKQVALSLPAFSENGAPKRP